MDINAISYKIRGAIFQVYNKLGPGLLESIYEQALYIELESMGLKVQRQVPINVIYKGMDLGMGYRMDLLVEGLVLVEIKSVDMISNVHLKQIQTYLKVTGKPLGLLVNFNSTDLKDSIKRIVSGHVDDI